MSIVLENVSCTYQAGTAHESKALKGVNLTIGDGEFVALIGRTGSGKSTLLQLLNGLQKPDCGRVLWNGADVHGGTVALRELRRRVGMVFQYPEHQLFESTVLEDVCFGGKNMGWGREKVERLARGALESMGVGEELYAASPFRLSGGQMRRVAMAGVLAMDPDVLVLDEPTAGLDPAGRREILEKLAALRREKGTGIVMASHVMEDVAEYADRILVLEDGRIKLEGTPAQVFSREEELVAAGLSVPAVTRVLNGLKQAGVSVKAEAVTLEEAKKEILEAWKRRESRSG